MVNSAIYVYSAILNYKDSATPVLFHQHYTFIYPLAPNLRFPEFRGEWERFKVSDILEFYPTNSLSWDQLDYETEEIYNLHYGLIHVGLPTLVDLTKSILPSIKEGVTIQNYELCKEGDIAFADASEDTNEVAKVVEFKNTDNKKVVCGLHCIHGRDIKNKTIPGFKGYAFSSSAFHNQIRSIAQGTKIYSINRSNFSECYVSIPTKGEQKKITVLLSLLDNRIATQSEAIEDLYKLKSAIVEKSYSGNRKSVKIGKIIRQVSQRNKALKYTTVLSVSNKMGFVSQSEQFEDRVVASDDISNYKIVSPDDFAYNPARINVGSVARLKSRSCGVVSPMYVCFHTKEEIIPQYLEHYFTTRRFKNEMQKRLAGSVRMCLSFEDLGDIQIPLPSIYEQELLARRIEVLSQKISLEEKTKSAYIRQKQYLLQQMFI